MPEIALLDCSSIIFPTVDARATVLLLALVALGVSWLESYSLSCSVSKRPVRGLWCQRPAFGAVLRSASCC